MSYSNGTATSSTDLLQQLVTFLVAAGWTQDMSQAEGSGWRAHLHLGSDYVHLRAAENEGVFQQSNGTTGYGLNLYMGTGFNSGQPWNNQTTGAPIGSGAAYPVGANAYLSAGPFTNYYFMTDSGGNNVVVVIERTPGVFMFVGWGTSLVKAGAFTGGQYFYGSSGGGWSGHALPGGSVAGYTTTSDCPGCLSDSEGQVCTYVRADVDSFTSKWISISPSVTNTQGYTGKVGSSSVKKPGFGANTEFPFYAITDGTTDFQSSQSSLQDGRANLLPVLLWVNRDGASSAYSLLGSLPMAFKANGVGNGFSNASEYAIGSDTYKMFPNFAILKVP